jgi:hypothetical protein
MSSLVGYPAKKMMACNGDYWTWIKPIGLNEIADKKILTYIRYSHFLTKTA